MVALPPSARSLLEDRAYGHLVTRNADGSPQLSMVWFDAEGDELLCNTAEGRVKVRNMRRDPRVIVSVQDLADPQSYLLVHGRATVASEGAAAHLRKLAERFFDPAEEEMLERYRGTDERRLLVRIVPERIGGVGPWNPPRGAAGDGETA